MNPMLEIATLERQIDLLMEEYPELAKDEDLRADVLEGQTNLDEVLTRIVRKATEARAFEAAITIEADQLLARKERYKSRGEAMRALALRIMQHADLAKRELPIATLSVRSGQRSVVITDTGQLSPSYMKSVTTTSPDKVMIKGLLEGGVDVPGACLSTGSPSLAIRTR